MNILFLLIVLDLLEEKIIILKNLKELRDTYYNNNRGDKIYTWEEKITYMNEKKMDEFIAQKDGDEGTYSHLIAELKYFENVVTYYCY